jgi:hypothetical protein
VEGVREGWFEAMRIPLLRGRGLQAGDGAAAVASETLARRLLPGQSPLGRRLALGDGTLVVTLVGVCADGPGTGPLAAPEPRLSLPLHLLPGSARTVFLRSPQSAPVLQRLLAAQALAVDPLLRPGPLVSLEAQGAEALEGLRTTTALLGLCALLSLALAALAARSALGQAMARGGLPPSRSLGRVAGHAALGALLGAGAALLATRMVRNQLLGLPALGPGLILDAVLLFGLAGGLAALAPGLRALREESRRRAREVEWAQLKGQLNPHLFFNAMNNLTALIPRDPAAAEQAALNLTALFRRLMTHGRQPVAPLGEERELVETYLSVEALRFGSRLQVAWAWDPALDGLMAPPFLLQPLVENALKHGLSPCPEGGLLEIRGRFEGGRVRLGVTNTGRPLGARREGGSGLANLESRLAFFFGAAAAFSLTSEASRTVAEVSFPAFEDCP